MTHFVPSDYCIFQHQNFFHTSLTTSIFYSTAVKFPPSNKLTVADVIDSKGKPRPEVLKHHFMAEGRVMDEVALKILSEGAAIMRQEKTLIEIEAPLTGRWVVMLLLLRC